MIFPELITWNLDMGPTASP